MLIPGQGMAWEKGRNPSPFHSFSSQLESKRRHVHYSFSESKDYFLREPESPEGKVMECSLRGLSE